MISSQNVSKQPDLSIDKSNQSISCVDLFCGAGGLTHGLTTGGINVVAGIDLDPECRFPYENNNTAQFIERNVHDLVKSDLDILFGDAQIRLLAGCAPCQPFSTYSRNGRKQRNDKNWELVKDFGRLIRETQPELVTMENVPQLLSHQVFNDFKRNLKGYKVWCELVDCDSYGVPQTRQRLVLLASRLGSVKLMSPAEFGQPKITVRQSISKLPTINAGDSDPKDPLHKASSLSELNLRRIKASKPGGTWRDWDEELLADCHRKTSGQTYPSVYGRMKWDAPAPTITTQFFGYGNGRFGHPKQDRAISLREAAILQTFPPDYKFVESDKRITFDSLGRLIGNAVPVRIGEVIARSLINHVKNLNSTP